MWFLVALFIGAFILAAFASPKVKLENARPSTLHDFNFPRANEGDPVAEIYGTVKFKSPNTIWVGDFAAVPITKKVKTGLFSSKKQTIGYKYYIGMDLAICLGPGFTFRRLWAGQYELKNMCLPGLQCENVITINSPDLFGGQDKNGGFTGDIALYCGNSTQTQDSYLISKIGPNVPAYNGIAHMVLRHCYIGNSTSIQPIYVEGAHFPNSLELPLNTHIMPNGLDANPIAILHWLYTNDFGDLAIDHATINASQWRDVADVLWNEGNGMSLIVSKAVSAKTLTGEILRQINGIIYQNPADGLLELKLIRNNYVIGDLPVLGPSQVKAITNFNKKLWEETSNRVRVTYTDRADDWKEGVPAVADDFGSIRYQGKVNATEISMPGVYTKELANAIAARELSNLNVPLYQADMIINRLASDLRPGDPFILHWPEYGIEQIVMRVRKFGLGTLENGEITLFAVQDEFALDAIVYAPPAQSPYVAANTSPGIVPYTLFELPYFLDYHSGFNTATGLTTFGFFTLKPSVYSLNYDVYVHSATSDVAVLEKAPYAPTAKLFGAFGQFAGFVAGLVPVLKIKNLSSAAILHTGSSSDARLGYGLLMLNGEILAYEGYADNGDGTFNLTNVHRAMIDTGWHGGAADDVLYFFDGQEGFIDNALAEGTAVTLKLTDRATGGVYPLADAPAIAYTPAKRTHAPLPPDYLTVNGARIAAPLATGGTSVTIAWRERNRLTDPNALHFEDDATESAESGTTYNLTVTLYGTVLFEIDGLTATSYSLAVTDAMVGRAVVNVYAQRDGIVSYEPGQTPLFVSPSDGSLTVDYDIVTVDTTERIKFT